jgi:hypothetical protein
MAGGGHHALTDGVRGIAVFTTSVCPSIYLLLLLLLGLWRLSLMSLLASTIATSCFAN